MRITIESRRGRPPRREFVAVIWSREAIGNIPRPVFYTMPSLTVAEAKLEAERALGLLDWGKGGRPENEASVAIDY